MSTQLSVVASGTAGPILGLGLGRPATKPFTYRDLIESLEKRLKAELEADGKSLKRLGNFRTAMNGWMASFGFAESSPVGAEFGAEFTAHLARHAETLAQEGKASTTIADRRSMLKVFREEWVSLLQSVGGAPEGDFGQALQTLAEESGLDQTALAAEAGVHPSIFAQWLKSTRWPTAEQLPAVSRLEEIFGLAPGALAAKLPKILFGKSGSVKTGLTGYRKHSKEVGKFVYHLKNFPPGLEAECHRLELFYTDAAWLRAHGLQRNSTWRRREHDGLCPTALRARGWIGAFCGYLRLPANPENPAAGGKGFAESELSLALLSDSGLICDFLRFKKERTYLKRYNHETRTSLDFCSALLRPGTGLLWQSPEMGARLPKPVPEEEWRAWCEGQRSVIKSVIKEVVEEGVAMTRDPFEPIRAIVLNNQHPMDVLLDLGCTYEASAPPRNALPRTKAFHYQRLLLIKFASFIPLRVFNFSVMTWRPDNTGNLYQKADGSWWVRFDPSYLKNHRGAAKDTPFDVPLHKSLAPYVDEFLHVHRPHLAGATLCDYVFRLGHFRSKATSEELARRVPTITLSTWVYRITQNFIEGCPGFGMHAFRHLIATEYIKNNPNGYAVAAAVLHDLEKTVRKNYAWVRPADRFNFWNDYLSEVIGKGESDKAKAREVVK